MGQDMQDCGSLESVQKVKLLDIKSILCVKLH